MSNKVEATFHPHPSYTAMEAAWDPVRREQARVALAQQLDKRAPRVGRGTRKDTR